VIQDLGFDEHPSPKEAGATQCCWLASASSRVSLAMSLLIAEGRSNAAEFLLPLKYRRDEALNPVWFVNDTATTAVEHEQRR
jgi:hypothetical protein